METSLQAKENQGQDIVDITEEKINVDEISEIVSSSTCGAVSIFVGTTRDNFDGKNVVQLEYEAYMPMAKKEMIKVCTSIRQKWEVCNIAMIHRIGVVPVKEASIVIAISSPHRRESLEAVHYAIDTVKATVPVWKKEIYKDDSSSWKQNKECSWSDNVPSHVQAKRGDKQGEASTSAAQQESCLSKVL